MTIQFLETDALEIYNTTLEEFTDWLGEALYPGDERRIFAETVAMILMGVYSKIDDAAKQRLLRYARGEVLDALGERLHVERLPPEAASDIFRFSVEEARQQNIVIPQGTRITQDGEIYFATDNVAIIEAGQLSVDVQGTCTTAGEAYNNINAGGITTLVDKIPYVSVTNLNGTTGGDDGEPYTEEGDDRYRERIHLAPTSFSVAGPDEAYKYYTLSANAQIVDAYIDVPSACVVNVYPLLAGGEIPGEEILTEVEETLSADDIRPLTDQVTAIAPTQVAYDIELTYYCTEENEEAAVMLVETDGGVIDNYISWQSEVLGRDINPDMLRGLIMSPDGHNMDGERVVEYVDITKPARTVLTKKQVAKHSGTLTVKHQVIEE